MAVAKRQARYVSRPGDSFTNIFEAAVRKSFVDEIKVVTQGINDTRARSKAIKVFIKRLEAEVEFTHRHYIKDDEYIPYGGDIEAFLEREIAKPIIRCAGRTARSSVTGSCPTNTFISTSRRNRRRIC